MCLSEGETGNNINYMFLDMTVVLCQQMIPVNNALSLKQKTQNDQHEIHYVWWHGLRRNVSKTVLNAVTKALSQFMIFSDTSANIDWKMYTQSKNKSVQLQPHFTQEAHFDTFQLRRHNYVPTFFHLWVRCNKAQSIKWNIRIING